MVVKNTNNETPIIISGITKGMYVVAHINFLNLSDPRYMAIAPKVPITTEIKLENKPTIREFPNALHICVDDAKSCLYHVKLNPVHDGAFDELKEKTTNMIIGK